MTNFPNFLLQQIPERLRVISQLVAFFCGIYLAITIALFILYPQHQDALTIDLIIFILLASLSIWVFIVTHNEKVSHNKFFQLSMFYMIITTFIISFKYCLIDYEPGYDPQNRISWSCLWVMVYSLIIPCPPRKIFFFVLIAVSITPFAILVANFLGYLDPPNSVIRNIVISHYTVACLVYIATKMLMKFHYERKSEMQLGNYELIEKISDGGMGEVWQAHHKMLRRYAAIKLIKESAMGADGPKDHQRILTRFQIEAQSTASLVSPHTINLYDYGATEDGRFYYAMELLEGVDLHNLIIEHGAIPAERVTSFLIQICDSLMEAHDNKLIHRDIKPHNLFVCCYGCKYDFIKVLDFGIVKCHDQPQCDMLRLTEVGKIIGTPKFMAPEMARGKEVDHRLDIYALGCVAYWLATGQHVFSNSSRIALLNDHVNTSPIRPSQRTENNVPKNLEKIIMKCLEKKPKDRIQTMKELHKQLITTKLAEKWTEKHKKKWWEKHFPSY